MGGHRLRPRQVLKIDGMGCAFRMLKCATLLSIFVNFLLIAFCDPLIFIAFQGAAAAAAGRGSPPPPGPAWWEEVVREVGG